MILAYVKLAVLLFVIIYFFLMLIKGIKLELLLIKNFKRHKRNLSLLPIFVYKNWHEKYNISKKNENYEKTNIEIKKVFKSFKTFLIIQSILLIIMLFI